MIVERTTVEDTLTGTLPDGNEVALMYMNATMDSSGKAVTLNINVMQPDAIAANIDLAQARITDFMEHIRTKMPGNNFAIHI